MFSSHPITLNSILFIQKLYTEFVQKLIDLNCIIKYIWIDTCIHEVTPMVKIHNHQTYKIPHDSLQPSLSALSPS